MSIALADLTRGRLAELAPDAVLVLPFGAIEQHGHHLPVGTDFLIVDAVARRAVELADTVSPLVLAPTVPYGSSDHHLAVGAALSLAPLEFEACARGLLRSAAASGFRRVFVINGHGGNEDLLRVAGQAAAGSGRLVVGGGAYWSLGRPALEQILPEPGLIPGHAGRFETSLMLALQPHLVQEAPRRAARPLESAEVFWYEDSAVWQEIDGYSDSPWEGSADEGSACLDAVVEATSRCLSEFDRLSYAGRGR